MSSHISPPSGLGVAVGSTVQLVCVVSSGDLPIFLSWRDPAGAVLPPADINGSISITITITTSTIADYGEYTCTANNSFGVGTDVFNVLQEGKTTIVR